MRASLHSPKKYAAYTLAGAALSALPTEAAPIFTDIPDTVYTHLDGDVQFDIDGDLTNDFSLTLTALTTPVNSEVHWNTLGSNGVAASGSPDFYTTALLPGATVDASLNYINSSTMLKVEPTLTEGEWPNDLSDPRYVGFRFMNASGLHYGYARVGTAASTGVAQAVVYDYAYESAANTAITIGDVDPGTGIPEPSGLSLFVLGAAGVAAMKRRRNRV